MKKIIISVGFLGLILSASAQCGSVDKGIRSINKNAVDEAKTIFAEAKLEIDAAEKNNQPLEAKCYAKYFYGAGHTELQFLLRDSKQDLVSKVALLNEAERLFSEFFTLDYQDKSLSARAQTDLESVANQQKNVAFDYFQQGDYESSLRLFEKAIQNKSKLGVQHLDLHAYESASITAARLGEYEKALEYNEFLIKHPQLKVGNKVNNQEKNLGKKAELLSSLGRIEEAISVLDSAITIFPESMQLQKKQLQIYTEVNDDDNALAILEKLTIKVQDDAKLFVIMGRIYNDQGFSDKSYQAYKTALSIEPKNKYALYGMGSYYVNRSNEYVASLNGVGNSASDQAAKSETVQQRVKNLDKAIFYFNQYLEIEPGDRATLNALKKIYSEKGDEAKVAEINNLLLGN